MTSSTDSTSGNASEHRPDSAGATLGAMLRQAREQRDLSVKDLAASLRLEPRIIERLEANQFDLLPEPAFIRGYVRSIAKQLEIDSAPLVAVFNLRFDQESPGLSDFESRAPVEITSDSNVIRYTTIALCAIMLVMVGLWWQAHDFGLPSLSDPDSPIAGAEPPTEPLSYSYARVEHPDDPFYRAPAPTPVAGEPAEPGPVAPPETPAAAEAPPPAPLAVAPAESAGADIVIVTLEDAWIEVSDAAGRRLHYSIAKPGNEITLDGQRPYTVVIGNTPAVTLRFAGEPYDIERHATDGIARFELGAESGQ